MNRPVIISVLFAVVFAAACREPLTDAQVLNYQATNVAIIETAAVHWATVLAPTPSPMPLPTVTPVPVAEQTARVVAAATTAAYRFAEQTAAVRHQQFLSDYEATRTAPSPTPVPPPTPIPPTATAIPPTPTPTRQPWERPVLDLNTANEQDMANLPANVQGDRLGLARAQRIGIFRQTFTIIELNDLLQIVGFGEATVAAIRLCDCTSQR